MPVFSGMRDERGRFIPRQTANDLEAAFYSVLHTKSQSSLDLFRNLWQQSGLRGDPFSYVFGPGAARIPLQQPRGGPGSFPPPMIHPNFPRWDQKYNQTPTGDPYFRVLQDIDKTEHEIRAILNRQQLASYRGTPFAGGPGTFAAPSFMGPHFFFGGGPGGGGMKFAGATYVGQSPGAAAAQMAGIRVTTNPPPPGGPGGGGRGGGGGGAGGGGRGGLGGAGGGFGGGLLGGIFGRGLLTPIVEGLVGFELLKEIAVPTYELNRQVIGPIAGASQRAWNFRDLGYAFSRAGGFGAEGFLTDLFPGERTTPGWPGAPSIVPPRWMQQLGIGPEEAMGILQQYGIPELSSQENIRNIQGLRIGQLMPGFAGMPDAAIEAARRFRGLGIAGPNALNPSGSTLGPPLLASLNMTLEDAVAHGMDRARILSAMESSLETLAKVSPAMPQWPVDNLFNSLMQTTLPGGRTGQLAATTIAGRLEAISTIGQDPVRTMIMLNQMRRYGANTAKGLGALLGPGIMNNMSPEMTTMFNQALQEQQAGRPVAAAMILQNLLTVGGGDRWQQLTEQAAPMFGMMTPGMRQLFVQRNALVPYQEQVGMGMKGAVGAVTSRTGLGSSMWTWLKSHGYSDAAASAVIGNASWESGGLQPGKWNPQGTSFGLFQFDKGGELPGYLQYAKLKGKDPSDWQTQMEYMDLAISKRMPGFKSSADIDEATGMYELGYERPKNPYATLNTRQALARQAYSTLGTTPSTGGLGGYAMWAGAPQTAGRLEAEQGVYIPPGLPTPSFYQSRAIAQTAGLAGSASVANQFGELIGPVTTGLATFSDKVNASTANLDKFAKAVDDATVRLRNAITGIFSGHASQTTPGPQVH